MVTCLHSYLLTSLASLLACNFFGSVVKLKHYRQKLYSKTLYTVFGYKNMLEICITHRQI